MRTFPITLIPKIKSEQIYFLEDENAISILSKYPIDSIIFIHFSNADGTKLSDQIRDRTLILNDTDAANVCFECAAPVQLLIELTWVQTY